MNLFDFAARIFIANPERQSGGDSARDMIRILVFVWIMVGTGIAGLLIPATAYPLQRRYVEALVTLTAGAFLAGAAMALGSFVGFLFGVPRASQRVREDSGKTSKAHKLYLPNTNLEEISDWLTKIIVGVGLVEIRSVVDWFGRWDS